MVPIWLGLLGGCAGTSSSGPLAVHVNLTAPVDGAEVSVRRIDVLGSVEPTGAAVIVSGKRTHVAGGTFKQPMSLSRGVSHIKIVATAAGYEPADLNIAVRSSPSAAPPATVERAENNAAPVINQPPAPASTRYSSRLRAGLLRSCDAVARLARSGRAEAYCECYAAHLEARESESTLIAWERAFLRGDATLPKWVKEAAASCIRDVRQSP